MPPEVAAAEAADPNTLQTEVVDTPVHTDPPAEDPPAEPNAEPESSAEAIKVATMMGWKPKDQWKGDTSNWRPAEAFLAEVPEVLKHTRQSNAKMKTQLDQVAGMVAKLTTTQRREMDSRHEAALEAAVEAGDTESARKILAEIKAAAAPTVDTGAVADFKTRNADWFEVNIEATAYASALDAQYAKISGGVTDPAGHMKKVEDGVRKKFPELFDDGKKEEPRQQQRAPLVGGGGRVAARRPNGEVTAADLTPSQRRAAEDMGVSTADYVKALNKINKQAAA